MASRPRISRQRWSDAFKKRIVAEASQPGETVARIARRYDLDGRRVSNWMKKFGSEVALVPVEVTPDDGNSPMLAPPPSTCIEVDLPCGSKVRFGADVGVELEPGSSLRSDSGNDVSDL